MAAEGFSCGSMLGQDSGRLWETSGFRVVAECLELAETPSEVCRDTLLEHIDDRQRHAGITQTLAEVCVKRDDLPSLRTTSLLGAFMATNPHELAQKQVEDSHVRAH
jgi:alcohol dehydrogenase class IV